MFPEIVTRIRVDTSGLVTGLNETKRKLGEATSAVTSFRNILAVAAGSTLVMFARNALNAAGSLGEMSQRIGMNVEALQALQHAARQSDVSVGEFEVSMRMLNRALGEAATGQNAQIALFKSLGVSVTDAGGRLRDASSVLDEIADVISKTESPAKRTQIAMEAFGRSGNQLLPMLQGGSAGLKTFREEAERLGLVLDERLVTAADAASDTLDKATRVISTNLTRAIITIAPHIEALSQVVAELAANWGSFVNYLMPDALAPSDELANRVAEQREKLRLLQRQRAETFGGMLRPSSKQFDAAIATAQAKLSELELRLRTTLREETQAFRPKPVGAAEGGAVDERILLEESKKIAEAFKTAADAEKEFAQELQAGAMFSIKYTEVLAAYEAQSKEITESVKVQADAEREWAKELQAGGDFTLKYTDVLAAYAQQSKEIAASVQVAADAEREYADEFKQVTLTMHPAEKALKDYGDEVRNVAKLSQVLGKDFNTVAAEISAIENALRKAVSEGMDPADERLQAMSERLRELRQAESLKSMFTEMLSSVTGAIEKMATGVIQGTLKMRDAFRNLARSIIVEFAQRVIRQALNPLINAMAQAAAAMFGGSGGGADRIALGSLGTVGGLTLGAAAANLGGMTNTPSLSYGGGVAGLYFAGRGLYDTFLGPTMFANGSAYLAPGLGNLVSGASALYGLGGIGAALSLAGAGTGNRYLSNLGALANVGYLGGTAGLGFAATGGALGAGAAGTTALGTSTSALGVAGAAPYLAAAALAAMSIYNAFQISGKNWKNVPEGQRIGTKIGAYASPINFLSGGLLGAFVPEKYSAFIDPIGSFVGGLIGSFFGKPDIPHEVREALEFGKATGPANTLLGRISGARTPNELLAALRSGAHKNYGGSAAATGPASAGYGFRVGGTWLGSYPGPDAQYRWGPEAIPALMASPESFRAQIQLGVGGGYLQQLNAPIEAAVRARVAQLQEVTEAINTALTDLLKPIAATPATTVGEQLAVTTARFRELMEVITDNADAQIASAKDLLLGLTDPQQILEQTATIRQLLEERYNGEVQLVRQFIAQIEVAENAWRSLRLAIEEQIVVLRLSGYGPTNPSAAVALTQGRFTDALAAFRQEQSPENAALVSQLAEPFLEAASRQFARPSRQFRDIFEEVTAGLAEIGDYARSREEELQAAIVSALGDSTTAIVGAIDTAAILEQLQVDNTAALNAALDALRVDTATVFSAMGFQISGGLALSTAVLAEIKTAQNSVAALMATQVPTELSLLGQIAANTAATAANLGAKPSPVADLGMALGGAGMGFAEGLDYVPYNNFPARLHRGEAVLTASEADEWRQNDGVMVTFAPGSIVIQGVSDPEIAAELAAEKMAERLERSLAVGSAGVKVASRGKRWKR